MMTEQPGAAPWESKQDLACGSTHPCHQLYFVSRGVAVRGGNQKALGLSEAHSLGPQTASWAVA